MTYTVKIEGEYEKNGDYEDIYGFNLYITKWDYENGNQTIFVSRFIHESDAELVKSCIENGKIEPFFKGEKL